MDQLTSQPTEAQIDAAITVLQEELTMPYMAHIDDFITSPEDPPAAALNVTRRAGNSREE